MRRLTAVIIFIALQIVLAITAGYWFLANCETEGRVRAGVGYSGVDLSGMDIDAAVETVGGAIDEKIEDGLASLVYKDTEFVFHFDEIGMKADYPGIKAALSPGVSDSYYSELLSAYTRGYGYGLKPAFTADGGEFREKLLRIKTLIDREPVDAGIEYFPDGEITRAPSENGAVFNVDEKYARLARVFFDDPFEPLDLDYPRDGGDAFVDVVAPRVPGALIEDVDFALAAAAAPTPGDFDAQLVGRVAEAINKVWAPKKGMAYDSFSFLRYIEEAGLPSDAPVREYDFVATALLHALLLCGEDYAKMDFIWSVEPETAAYPGLSGLQVGLLRDADGAAAGARGLSDFRFSNTLSCDIVIFAYVADGALNVAVAGNSSVYRKYEVNTVAGENSVELYRDGKRLSEAPYSP